ncbi:DUF1016 domain-containing protein [Caulobacter sp. 602-2]|uniref:DUF1016 domain-containing protein n=1 Tax=Caulobacter sp. 602-2 TaxID=2710887 RepID=A0A6G4QV45_9CAUL|nr:PDDEXK nuclease domain-containing protein [Caulobacter sp. 602-2]NGM49317.1 DUF1016 domain-containing protein [Caulobacter sp. 602-2]
MAGLIPRPEDYGVFLDALKARVRSARLSTALAVNQELIGLYWSIGRDIGARQLSAGWGAKIIDTLAADLRTAFPEMTGFSPRNLRYMRDFAAAYPDLEFVQQLAAKLPWGHHIALLGARGDDERRFYVRQAVAQGWSRNVLIHQLRSDLYRRQGQALTNFGRTLPAPQSELAQQLIKDPYAFDFLAMTPDMLERDLERGLLEQLRQLILELGKGFAFVGSQYRLEVGDQDFRLDLLFYHLRLRCYVVFELKVEAFKPEFAGKMNFYLSAVDDQLRHADDQPSIGIILCQTRNETIVEYALRDSVKPMGVATYTVSAAALPAPLESVLPTVQDLSRQLPTAMRLFRLRTEIEKRLRRLLGEMAGEPTMRSLLIQSSALGVPAEDIAQVIDALSAMTDAARGLEVDALRTAGAEVAAEAFLARLHSLSPR